MTFLGVGEWLAQRSALTPEKVGLVDGETGARYTWHMLNIRARALATVLRECYAVGQGDRVAVLAFNAPEYLDAFYACALLGAILVPLNWRLTPTELAALLHDCAPRVLLADARFAAEASDVAGRQPGELAVLPFADFPGADVTLAARATPFTTVDGEEPALLLYTSGTTGIPKGALLSHRMITWNAVNTQISWGLRDDDITPTFAPLFHAGGLNVLTTPLAHCGGTVVLLRSSEPEAIVRSIETQRCTIVFAVPTVFQRMMEHHAFETTDWSSVRFCVTGGSSCPLPVIERYAARGLVFRQGYGLTEVGVNCFSLAPEDALRKAGSVGQPVFHSRARIVDEAENDVAPGSVGELVLAGSHVCSGYWRRPEATAEAYRDGWWHTGDLATRDTDGYYYIVGRKKDMYISGGENIYPAEIENVLAEHPDIVEAAVIAKPDARWGEVGVAFVVPRDPDALTDDGVIAWCGGRLARYKLPRRVVFVESLPRNAMGKVIKQELRERYGSGG
ncbi:MAG TPA: long-chain fatty acid--CoA ligase [Ktedonobacterales bacterium]